MVADYTTIVLSLTTKQALNATSQIFVYFPAWSDGGAYMMSYIGNMLPSCTGLTGLNANLNCSFNFQNNVLTVNNLTPTTAALPGQSLSFSVYGF